MGQTLSEPVVEKRSAFGEDDRLLYGVSEMQGWRLSELSRFFVNNPPLSSYPGRGPRKEQGKKKKEP